MYFKKQKGKGKTVMEQISDGGLLNKDYPHINNNNNNNNNYSKETQSALKILNSTNTNFIKGGRSKKYFKSKKGRSNKSKSKKNKTIKKKYI